MSIHMAMKMPIRATDKMANDHVLLMNDSYEWIEI